MTAILMVSMLFSTVLAGPVQPFNRWGYANDSGGTPLSGQEIYSWINGVSYGMDTTDAVGLFSLDTYGDDTTPDAIKTGGYNGDTVYYSSFDMTTMGVNMDETDSWIVGGFNTVAADLNEAAAPITLLKVSAVSVGPTPYIGIWDPGATVLTNYGLDIGDTGTLTPLNMGDVYPGGVIGAVTFFNAVPYGGVGAANSIQLGELSTGFIVDRVEYGAIAAEPENTILTDAVSPPSGQEIHRIPDLSGTDTNDCAVDFALGPAKTFGGVTYGPPAPTGLRINVVGPQDTATDCELTWTDSATAVSYNIYRGSAIEAIDFVTPIANVAQGVGTYIDPGAVPGSPEYYYCLRSVDGGGVEGESSATVGKFTTTYSAGWNAFGSPFEYFPDAVDAWGYYLSDWWLIDQTSPEAIPSASALSTYDQAGQAWTVRIPTAPPFVPSYEINSIMDGCMVYMDSANDYTWTGWPCEQIRTANFAGKAILAAPTTFRVAINGADIDLSWDPVAGADHYEVFTATDRCLENYNFGAPAYSGGLTTWTDIGAAATIGDTYYIVAAADGDGDLGDSTYALGKHVRDFSAGWNAFTTPFSPLKYDALDPWGYQLSDWKLIDQTSPDAIPSASALSTYDQPGQAWTVRIPTAPPFVPSYEIMPMGDGSMVYMDAAGTYCWRS